ncbi:hypothetical protein nbrc107696_25470 [Gordonia spumicola]|uniref:Uncharacterized protein n=1 Tax=Gordonia spumicola TaxID=589161 RepID=A0A7I9VAG4_9ACTN|nr:PQQ-binding-like beta-propeller repeat protein [Gordonia spumicola]GEE02101.1 hypothetical protein nbrc107696_25470 [Gordonia spumicola]
MTDIPAADPAPRTLSAYAIGACVGLAILALAGGVFALTSESPVLDADSTVASLSAVAIAAAACTFLAVAVVVCLRGRHRGEIAWFVGWLAGPSTIATIVFASHLGKDPDLYRFLDSRGAVVASLAGAVAGSVALVATLAIAVSGGRRGVLVAMLTAIAVVAAGVGGSAPLMRAYADTPWMPVVVEPATPLGGMPDAVGAPVYRIDIAERGDVTVHGGMVMVAEGSKLTARDARTGRTVWKVRFGDLSPAGRSGPALLQQEVVRGGTAIRIGREGGVTLDVDIRTGRVVSRGRLVKEESGTGKNSTSLPDGRTVTMSSNDRATVTDADGRVIDEFVVPENFSVDQLADGPRGMIVLSWSSDPGDGTLRIRDVARHRTVTVDLAGLHLTPGETLSIREVAAVGDNLLIASNDTLVTVDVDRNRVVSRTPSPCGLQGWMFAAWSTPGATIVRCSSAVGDSRFLIGMA